MKLKKVILGCCVLPLLAASACTKTTDAASRKTVFMQADMNELERDRVPGTVDDVWVGPMVDTIRVPGALDPRGVTYRKQHTAVVEIRNGRFQQVEYPEPPAQGR